jgi:hypothetical protein
MYKFPDEPVDWDPKMKWTDRLYLRAASFTPLVLYPGTKRRGRYEYKNKVLPAGSVLDFSMGKRKGVVKFDGPVTIPALFDMTNRYTAENPWMSITPFELITLRAGTKRAKGHTVVAGLGLGHQLIEVMKRKQVTRVTLVEREMDIVRLILPRLKNYLPDKPLSVTVADAREVVPKLTADVALIDIFPSYGYNQFVPCPNIPTVWCWGGSCT